MKIYDAKKIEIADVPVTKNAKHEQELMKSDYIRLEWSQEEYMPLPVGAYIEHEGVKYSLFGQYVPDNNGGVYQYKPEFQHPMMLLAHTPCLLTTRDSVGKEIKQTDWTYTGILSTILGRLQGIIYDQLGIMLTFKTKFKPTTDVEESATCTFSGVDIISAFSEVCNQFGGIEYHIDWEGKTVWFGDIFLGDEVSLEEGGNVGMASKSMNSKDYANYFIVRGGTRNITNKTASGDNVQSDSRLSIDDMDKRASTEQPRVQKILTFDYIYPQLDLYVYNVRKRVRRLKDEDKQYIVKRYNADGTVAEYQTYAVYYMRLAYKEGEAWKDYIINNPSDDIVAGKKLTASFETNEKGTHSQLAGREYELIYHKSDKTIIANPTIGDSGVNILAGDYEIVFEQDGDLIIPNIDTLQPWGNSTPDDTCDKVVLYNIVMSDEYITNAKVRLAEEAEKEIMRQYTDKTNYTVHSNPIEFAKQNPGLSIGRAVRYRTLSGEVMSTRINRLSTQLDYPIEQEITLGNAVIKGNTQQLREDVKSISVAIDVNESSATRINSMLNSVMRELMEYDAHLLHKDRDDETAYKLTMSELLVKGIAKILSNVSVGGKVSTNGIENDGNNITKGLTELYNAISSHGFKNSMTAGSGWQIDANGNAQMQSIEVRSYMRVLELVMNRLSAEESDFIFTESGTVETATLNEDGTYTLVMRKKTDKDITPFQEGDILKGVVNNLAEQGTVGVNYYTSWIQVKEVNQTTNSIKVAVYPDNEVPSGTNFPPCELMVLHRWGNADETKTKRQSCWYISSIEKRIVMLDGVTQPKLEESNYASFYGLPFEMENFKGYSLNQNQPYLYVRGAFLQDVCFIDYLGKVVKQERYRGVWSQDVANSKDPYIVTQTTFDTVYHKNAKWQCNSTIGSKEEPSESTTDWTKLSEGGKGSDGKSAAKAYVTSNDIAIPTDANGIVTEDFQIGNTFSLMVDGKNCTDLQVTMDETTATNAFQAQLNQLWLTITSSKGAEFGSLAYTLHFTVTGVLDNVIYSDVVTILVRPNRKGDKGEQGIQGPRGLQGLQGEKGEQGIPGTDGIDGIDGRTSWFHIKYSSVANPTSASQMTETPSTYIGTYVDFTEQDSTDPKKYRWHRFEGLQGEKGEQGIPGVGVDGKTTYLHIKYSNDGGKTFTGNNGETVGDYIGVCTDYEHDDPTSVSAYTWSKTKGEPGKDGIDGIDGVDGIDGADGALPNLFGYDTKVECLVGHHNVVHTKTGFAVVLDSLSDDDTSSDRYCLLRVKDFTDGEGTYSVSGYITHSAGGKFEFDCGDVTPQTMTLTANKRTRFAKKFELPKNSYKHIDFEFFMSGLINVEELKIERTDNVVSECTPFVTLAHDSITQKQNILLDTNFMKTSNRTIWSVFNGDIVENAYNGLSAFHYKDSRSASVTTAVEILSQKFVGKLKPSTWYTLSMFTKVKGKVIPYIGSNVTRNWDQTGKNKGADAVLCDEYIVSTSATTNTHQLEESTEYKRHSITFFTAPDLTNADERMYFYIWAQAEIYVTMLKLEECEKPTDWQLNEADRKGEKGDNGKTGKPLAGPTMWDSSVWYMSGKGDDEAYQSIVINPKYPKQMYLCGYSHSGKEPLAETSTSSVDTCTEEKPWVQVPYQDFVATKVLFAERGKIENLDITNATIQGTITDMAVKTEAEWDKITNSLVPKEEKDYVESNRNFQIVDPSKAGSYFIPTFYPTGRNSNSLIVFLPTYNPSTDYDIITCNTTQSNVKKRYKIPKYQTAGTHIRITKGGAPLEYSRWAYLEDAEYGRLWTSNNGNNRNTIRDIYNMGTLICADHKIFKVTDGNGKHGHNIQGAWYYGDSDYKHGRLSVNGTVARMLWLMPGQTVELVSQIEEIDNTKCLVWSVVNASDFTAVNINADLTKRKTYDQNFESLTPIEFHGESGILAPDLAGNVDNWEDCFIAHKKIDNLLLNGETKRIPSLFINRNDPAKDDGYPIAEFYIP